MKKSREFLILVLVAILAVFWVAEFFIGRASSRDNFYKAADAMLTQLRHSISNNISDSEAIEKELEAECIAKARMCAYLLELNPEIENTSMLRKVARRLDVDEINLFDTEGVIYEGTERKYFKLTMNDGEQIGFFKPMLNDKKKELCQKSTPNTHSGEIFMYAMVWKQDGSGLVQIGLRPKRFEETLQRANLPVLFSQIPYGKDSVYFAIELNSKKIEACTEPSYTDRFFEDVFPTVSFDFMKDDDIEENNLKRTKEKKFTALVMQDKKSYCYIRTFDDFDYAICVCEAISSVDSPVYISSILTGILGFFLFVVFYVIFVFLLKIKTKEVKSKADLLLKEEKDANALLKKVFGQSEAANARKTKFMFDMSKDILTPVNSILGYVNMLEKNSEQKDKVVAYIGDIKKSAAGLLNKINMVFQMSSIETDNVNIMDNNVWDAKEFTDTLMIVFGEEIERKHLNIVRTMDVEHDKIYCDNEKLREIFHNILSNSIKYTKEGGRIEINVTEMPCEKNGVVFYRTSIVDTGIGISREFLPHIFDDFSKDSYSVESGTTGTGLGLGIAKRLIELMGGTIRVESELGHGTTVIVTLPHRIVTE